ncbi:MAG: glycosyltransferase [Solirubrobacterales bacterium]
MPRVVSASIFFPRGGSAHVLRSLARELPAYGWEVTLVSGSRHDGELGDAARFYAGFDVREVDYTAALRAPDPMDPPAGAAPMHPSYEDRPHAPDRVFASLSDAEYARQVDAWAHALTAAGAASADVLHLSHLTPVNAAAARVAPHVPVAGHLHGTELLMLEQIAAGAPPTWAHAAAWADRMRAWAQAASRLILLSETQVDRAVAALGIDPARCRVMPNGYDPRTFAPAARPVDRQALWRRRLVAEPRGWRPGHAAGSVAYAEADLAAFAGGPTLLYVGRFTEVKRVGLVIAAYARARPRFATRAPLVIVGGHAGSGRASTPSTRSGASACPTSSWPAGTTTTSCPTSCTPATRSCSPRCASSSGRCWSRRWRARSRRSRSTASGRRGSSRTGARDGSSSPTTRRRWPRRWSRRSTTARSAGGAAGPRSRRRAPSTRGRRSPRPWRRPWTRR